ncbi:hypothetical protein [Micromonospora chalcea]|uniref:hypothetical protein n=1 Tax=Micromonospora chalcea TaxID=1874 RepID=UPI00292A5B85|nr:hypothetical protein [Micromonospora chalcea]
MNLLLGLPATVPLFLARYIIVNGPLAALGWTRRDSGENDGMLPWVIVAVPVFCAFGLAWGLVNVWMRRRTTAASAAQYWFACVAASLSPYVAGFFLL